MDSTASDGTYASIDVTNGPSTLTIAGGETRMDALVVSGGNLTISGGSLNFYWPGHSPRGGGNNAHPVH